MQPKNVLGIYLAKDHAAVVCLTIDDRGRRVSACFSVSPDGAEQPAAQIIPQRIAALCAERKITFSETAVALDCGLFLQHSVRSEFTDVKKITQTVRFDTEEVLGADATDFAIAFKIDASDKAGSTLSVFTAKKQMLAELISAFAASNLDPGSVEPDVNCLARFILANVSLPADARPLFALLGRQNAYFVSPLTAVWQGAVPSAPASMRTFLLRPQNRTEQLIKQVSMTAALLQTGEAVNRIEVFDSAKSVNTGEVAKNLTIQTELIDVIDSARVTPEQVADCPDTVEFVIAYGAALSFADPPRNANWRSDFMPYQGRKMRLQKTIKLLSVAASVLMFALGLYGLMNALQVNKYRASLREKFAKEYAAVMFGQKAPGTETATVKLQTKEAVRKLSTALRRVKDAQKGGVSLTGEEAVAGKLTLVLQAFNKCAKETGINVDSVSITDKAITISGNTSSPDSTLKVFDALRQTGLNVLQQRISSEGGRSSFNVTVEPQKGKAGE